MRPTIYRIHLERSAPGFFYCAVLRSDERLHGVDFGNHFEKCGQGTGAHDWSAAYEAIESARKLRRRRSASF